MTDLSPAPLVNAPLPTFAPSPTSAPFAPVVPSWEPAAYPQPPIPTYAPSEPPVEPVPAPKPSQQEQQKRVAKTTLDRAQVRRVIASVIELQKLTVGELSLVASVLGLAPSAELADVALTSLTASARDLSATTDLSMIISADQLSAGVDALALGRTRLRAVWKLSHGLGLVGAELPASDAKAAIALVRALHDAGSDEVRNDLAEGLRLAGRSA